MLTKRLKEYVHELGITRQAFYKLLKRWIFKKAERWAYSISEADYNNLISYYGIRNKTMETRR